MGIYSDAKVKDALTDMIASIERIKNDMAEIREAQIVLNKRFSYLDEKLVTVLKMAKGK